MTEFLCTECKNHSDMIHSGVLLDDDSDTNVVISLHDSKGRIIYQRPGDFDTDDIRALCAFCGTLIDPVVFCEIAYSQYNPSNFYPK